MSLLGFAPVGFSPVPKAPVSKPQVPSESAGSMAKVEVGGSMGYTGGSGSDSGSATSSINFTC